MIPRFTVQQILQQQSPAPSFNAYSESVITQLKACRTAALGYHHYRCDDPDCGSAHYQYHSCHNRHCPSCNGMRQDEWQEDRLRELLPVKYFHVVFTLPEELNSLVMGNRKELFTLLFESASYSLLTLSKDTKWLGAVPSIVAVLHTWGQQLSFHPHVHCIVSGGGVDEQLNWKKLKHESKNGYLFPYNVMEPLYKKHFLRRLHEKIKSQTVVLPEKVDWQAMKKMLYQKKWIVYAKHPMGNPSVVVEYLARYAHKVAISNYRIINIDNERVTFNYKDYRSGGKTKQMTLSIDEFIRRFEQHILPKGFVKMRHYGILSNKNRSRRIREILQKMKLPPPPDKVHIPLAVRMFEKYGIDITLCRCCKRGHLQLVCIVLPNNRGSPFRVKPAETILKTNTQLQ